MSCLGRKLGGIGFFYFTFQILIFFFSSGSYFRKFIKVLSTPRPNHINNSPKSTVMEQRQTPSYAPPSPPIKEHLCLILQVKYLLSIETQKSTTRASHQAQSSQALIHHTSGLLRLNSLLNREKTTRSVWLVWRWGRIRGIGMWIGRMGREKRTMG